MFRYLVLGLLRDGKPRHGYGLMKEYLERAAVELSTGNFYRELQKLANEGLVRTASNPEGADPRRAPYEITPAGIAAFDSWLTRPTSATPADYEDELSYRALFLTESDRHLARALLDRWQEALWISGKMLEREREAVVTRTPNNDRSFRALLFLLGRRLKHVAADLQFLEEFRDAYETWVAQSEGQPRTPAQQTSVGSQNRKRPLETP